MGTVRCWMEEGHVFAKLGDRTALMDTGAPASIGKGNFEFADKSHQPRESLGPVSLETFSEFVPVDFDLLLGMDVLSTVDFSINLKDECLQWNTDIPGQGISVPLQSVEGIPLISCDIGNTTASCFLDTGAKLSYAPKISASNQAPFGEALDFYPGYGEFSTSVYSLCPMTFQNNCR